MGVLRLNAFHVCPFMCCDGLKRLELLQPRSGISKSNTSSQKCQLWPPRRMHQTCHSRLAPCARQTCSSGDRLARQCNLRARAGLNKFHTKHQVSTQESKSITNTAPKERQLWPPRRMHQTCHSRLTPCTRQTCSSGDRLARQCHLRARAGLNKFHTKHQVSTQH